MMQACKIACREDEAWAGEEVLIMAKLGPIDAMKGEIG